MTKLTSGIQGVKKAICEKVVKSSVKGTSAGSGRDGAASSVVMTSASGTQEITGDDERSTFQTVLVFSRVAPLQ